MAFKTISLRGYSSLWFLPCLFLAQLLFFWVMKKGKLWQGVLLLLSLLAGLFTDPFNQYLTNARKVDDATSGTTTANDSQSNTSLGKQSDVNEQNLNEQTVDFNTRKSSKDDSSVSSGKTNGSNIGNTKSTEDYVLHVFGKSAGANYAKLIKEFRDNLLNIDMDIISDLGELFMLIW